LCNGVDLAVEWRNRRWQKLLDLIERLPRHSAYIEAVSEDEAVAAQMLNMPDDTKPARRRLSEYDVVVETLSTLVDRVGELINAVMASKGVRPRRIPPAPRPVTALQKLRERRRRVEHVSLVSKLLPHKAKELTGPPIPLPGPQNRPPARPQLPRGTSGR
jgi:hypothetical protein